MSTLTAKEMLVSLNSGGLTDKQIADRTGTTQATITRIRNGVHAEPKHKTWAAINQFYLEQAAAAAVVSARAQGTGDAAP